MTDCQVLHCRMRSCQVRYDAAQQVFVLDCHTIAHTWARGLTSTLKALCSPSFSVTSILQTLPTIKAKRHGRHHGNRLDDWLRRWVQSLTAWPRAVVARSSEEQALVTALSERDWVLLACQFPVGRCDWRLATAIDLVAMDARGRLVVIDLKYNMDDFFSVGLPSMAFEPPLPPWPVSCQFKAFLQLWVSVHLLHRSDHPWRGRAWGGAYVLRVFHDEKEAVQHAIIPVPAWLSRCRAAWWPALAQALAASASQTQAERQATLAAGTKRAARRRKSAQAPYARKAARR